MRLCGKMLLERCVEIQFRKALNRCCQQLLGAFLFIGENVNLVGFREMFALLENVLQLLDKWGGGVLQWWRKEKI